MWIGWQVHKMAYQGAALDRGQSLIPRVALLMLAGLFLLDDCHAVYLWVGRRPTAADTDDPESVVAGTANTRFTSAKICAMRTALDYCSGILLSVLLPLKVRPYGIIQIRLLHTFNGPLSGTTWVTVSGSGISRAICKSASRSRQITTPAPHHSVFYRPDALPATQAM